MSCANETSTLHVMHKSSAWPSLFKNCMAPLAYWWPCNQRMLIILLLEILQLDLTILRSTPVLGYTLSRKVEYLLGLCKITFALLTSFLLNLKQSLQMLCIIKEIGSPLALSRLSSLLDQINVGLNLLRDIFN